MICYKFGPNNNSQGVVIAVVKAHCSGLYCHPIGMYRYFFIRLFLPQCIHKGKGKVVPVLFLTEHHAMKAYWGSGGIVPLIL
jgi:hypothetical protein